MTSDFKAVTAVLAGAAVIVVGFIALRPGTTEIEYLPPVTLGDPQDVGPSGTAPGVVIGKSESGGSSFLVLHFGHPTYRITVQFYAPPGCFELIDFGDQWPVPLAECSTDFPVAGEVTGLGNTGTGESIVSVEFEVVQDCFDQIVRGESWPSDVPECGLQP